MSPFSMLLQVLTETNNQRDRLELMLLSGDLRRQCGHLLPAISSALGQPREQFDAEAALILLLRGLWSMVPSSLFEALQPDFEELATKALFERLETKDLPEVLIRQLAIVFKRLRRSHRYGRETESLDLERTNHKEIMKRQALRCQLCRYLFNEADLFQEVEADLDEETLEPISRLPGEVALARYFRRPTLDHIIPHFLGGDGLENLQILCTSCNLGKGESLAWIFRTGWLPASRLQSYFQLTPSLRYAALSRHHSSMKEPFKESEELRLFLRNERRLLTLENIAVATSVTQFSP
ncbi:MAG: HNH endonuclease [Vulcanimicrobiota bacterium]